MAEFVEEIEKISQIIENEQHGCEFWREGVMGGYCKAIMMRCDIKNMHKEQIQRCAKNKYSVEKGE